MVGRILNLISDHIPPAEAIYEYDYRAFGYYDAIKIGRNLFEGNQDILSRFWSESVVQTANLSGGYSIQAIYLFSDEDENTDIDFWENKTLPFLFIIMIQLSNEGSELPAFKNILEQQITQHFNTPGTDIKLQIMSYYTLDENDIVCAIKCADYAAGMSILNSLHAPMNQINLGGGKYAQIAYTFTISGILADFDEALKNVVDKDCECQIHVVERYPGTIEDICCHEQLKNKSGLKKNMLLGRDDFLITFNFQHWGEVLELYREERGIFGKSQVHMDKVLSVSTKFIYENLETIKLGDGSLGYPRGSARICSGLKDVLRKKYGELVSQENAILYGSDNGNQQEIENQLAYYKAIWQIINSIEKFEYQAFPDYVYLTIYEPLKMLVYKIVEFENINYDLRCIADIYRFLTAVNQISQNLNKADRQFTQIPELNAGSYHVPIKLTAYYSVFIYKVKEFLNTWFGKGNFYEFLLHPGMNETIRVRKLFQDQNDKNRLLLVEMPEKQVFEPQYAIITLIHEAAHFVGSLLRNRRHRYRMMNLSMARMIPIAAYLDKRTNEFMTNESFVYLERELRDQFEIRIEKEREYLKGTKTDIDEDLFSHSEYLEILMQNALNTFLGESLNEKGDIFETIFGFYIKNQVDRGSLQAGCEKMLWERKNEFEKCFSEFIYDLQCGKTEDNKKLITVKFMLDILFYLLKECFSDIVSILLLGLSYTDYLNSILYNVSIPLENVAESEISIRVALVMEIMVSKFRTGRNFPDDSWDINDIRNLYAQDKTDKKEFYRTLLAVRNIIAEEPQEEEVLLKLDLTSHNKKISVTDICYDSKVLNYLAEYLMGCKKELCEKIHGDGKKEIEEIREAYKKLTEHYDVAGRIIFINQFVDQYRKKILTKNHKNMI
ncbi:MAG: hypothetical protein HFG70_11235 [Hungatella sp.]|nr:hypothetical protein [Hungatella sp.]